MGDSVHRYGVQTGLIWREQVCRSLLQILQDLRRDTLPFTQDVTSLHVPGVGLMTPLKGECE
jgi:hypothetical protein